MKKLENGLWKRDSGNYYKTAPGTCGCCGCALYNEITHQDCLRTKKYNCTRTIGNSIFKKLTPEEVLQMNKKKFIVRYHAHDENDIIEASCPEHACILAQAKRIQNGEEDVKVKQVKEITPSIIKLGKYEITNNNGILSVKRYGEEWRKQDLIGDNLMLALVERIEELEKILTKHAIIIKND